MTTAEALKLAKAGFTPADIIALAQASGSTGAASTVAAPPKVKAETPAWIVQHGINKAARRALAADLRAKGVSLVGPKGSAAWAKAKAAAKVA